MHIAVGLTLMFAAWVALRNFERHMAMWRKARSERQGLYPALVSLVVLLWLGTAALWVMWAR